MNIWEGVYESFEAANGDSDAWSTGTWTERSLRKAAQSRSDSRTPGFAPITTRCHEYCLPIIAALAQAERGRLRVLDFGGSVGLRFHAVVDALGRPDDVEFHVVDNERVCEAGRAAFADDARILFHPRVPSDVAFDVVHLGSSIQYVRDWATLVGSLVGSKPKYLVFDDVPAGDIPTFVTLQNDYGQKIPHWFFNVREFVDRVVSATGYRLCYKARFVATVLGTTGPLPMGNFPPEYRIDYAYNLAFVAP